MNGYEQLEKIRRLKDELRDAVRSSGALSLIKEATVYLDDNECDDINAMVWCFRDELQSLLRVYNDCFELVARCEIILANCQNAADAVSAIEASLNGQGEYSRTTPVSVAALRQLCNAFWIWRLDLR